MEANSTIVTEAKKYIIYIYEYIYIYNSQIHYYKVKKVVILYVAFKKKKFVFPLLNHQMSIDTMEFMPIIPMLVIGENFEMVNKIKNKNTH